MIHPVRFRAAPLRVWLPALAAVLAPVALPAAFAEKVVKDGIAVEFSIQPVDGKAGTLTEGHYARVTLAITDAATGNPVSGVYPGAWMDRLTPAGGSTALKERIDAPVECKKKVESFLGGSIMSRPEADLNVYYVLALNDDATITVVDPLFGYGNSKMLTMIFLPSPGEDWALSEDGERLFVSMPAVDRVAVVGTADWKVIAEVETGDNPRRVALQPDGQYLWVATETGVSVVDARKLARAADIPTAKGAHDLAVSSDNRFAFVTNEADGTVSVIDVGRLVELRKVKTGAGPASIAWSSQAQAAYVAVSAGTVVAVDGASAEPRATVPIGPGLGQIRFSPDGRLAFIIQPEAKAVHLLDAASNRVVQTADVETGPDQVTFSQELAYIRHRGSPSVLMIPLKAVGEPGKPVPVIDFPGGQSPPGKLEMATPADGIVPAPGDASMLVTNPDDKAIYYYKEGMAAPMGNFRNYGKKPRAALVVNRTLRESKPGVYETVTKLSRSGNYELALFLSSPKVVHCFPLKVAEDAALAASRKQPLDVTVQTDKSVVGVGSPVEVRFKLTEPQSGAPKTGLKDVRVLTFLSPGFRQQRHWAEEVGKGLYKISFTPPEEGVYFVFLEIASAGMEFQKSPFLVLTAESQTAQKEPGR